MDEDEVYYLTLRCGECENYDCKICPQGTYVPEDSLRGCTRKVREDDVAKFEHYMVEVLPFMKTYSKEAASRTYKEIIDFLFYIYSCPLGQKLGKSGRVLIN